MILNAKIGGLWIFWQFRAVTQVYIIHKVAPQNNRYAIQIEFGSCILTYREHPNFQLYY